MTTDTNAHLGHWPFRRHGFEDTARFVAKLKAVGVTAAWVANSEGVLHKDLAAANARLAAECAASNGFLTSVGTVNPSLPGWEDDLRRCREVHGMPSVRVYPNYHGYAVDSPEFAKLLGLAAAAKVLVQLVVKMEDERTHHPLIRVADVSLAALPKLVAATPGVRLQVLNCPVSPATEALVPLARSGAVSFDFAMQESVGVVARFADRVGADRVLFGSHFPLFHAESSVLKLKEAALPPDTEKAVRAGNAAKLLAAG